MSIEVANLLARIQMVADGVPEVLRATEEVRKKLEGMGEAGSAAANKMSESQIKAAVALGRYEAAVAKAAETQNALSVAEAKSGSNAEEAAKKVAELTDELVKLKAAASGGDIADADLNRMRSIENQISGYREVTSAASANALAQHRVLSAGERLVVSNRRLSDETVVVGKRFRVLTTEITGLISAFRTGTLGSTLLARALIRVGDAAKGGGGAGGLLKGLAIGAAVTVGVAALAFLVKGISQIGPAIERSHLPRLSADLVEVANHAGKTGGALQGLAVTIGNVFQSQNISNADELVGVVARLADQLRFLTADANLESAIQAITQGISTGNLDQVAKTFGLSADRLRAAMGDMEGLTDAEKTIRAINALLEETPQHLEEINTAIAAQTEGWVALGVGVQSFWEKIGVGLSQIVDAGGAVLDSVARGWSDAADQRNRMRDAEMFLTRELDKGTDALQATGEALVFLSENGALTVTNMQKLEAISGLTAAEIKLLEDSLVAMGIALPDTGLGAFVGDLEDVPPAAFDAEKAIRDFYDQVNNSNSIVDSIKGLAVAWHNMEDDLTAGTAATAFAQLGNVIEMVVTDGIGSLELLRLQAEAAGKVGFATPEQVAAAMAAYDAIEGALTPIAEEAERVRAKLANDVTGGLNQTQGAAETATTSVANYISVLNQIPASVTTDVILNFLTMGAVGGGLPTGGVPRSGITPSVDAQTTPTARAAEAAAAAAAVQKQGSLHDQLEESRTSAPGNAQNTLSDPLADVFDIFGLGGPGKKGGGGGAGDSLAATIEQIRALMDAVNMAILIGLRGGVAVGMSGNAIPSIGGTFVSAEGGALQLQVQNVIIKGVWDFADPAAKRTILEELESLLAGLKADAS